MTRGRFITLEGGEGAGKTTQLKALANALRACGLDVVETREPGGSDGAEAIRSLLLSGSGDRWDVRAEAMLFAAARSDHVERLILPALERGAWVLCDRFIDSSRAYQGGPDGLPDDELMTLHRIGTGGLLPDRTLLLHLDADTAHARERARDGGAADRIGGRDRAYHDRVRGAFLSMAEKEQARFRLVDASGATETVTIALLDALADMLPR